MNVDLIALIANILVIATIVFIAAWLIWRAGLMRQPSTSARKPMDERNERIELNKIKEPDQRTERTDLELNEINGRTGPTELNEMNGRHGPTELNEMPGRINRRD